MEDKPKVVIVGGGINGLISAYVFSQYKGVEVSVFEKKGVYGGEWLNSEGLKFIPHYYEIEKVFKELDLHYSAFSYRSGILLKDKIYSLPECLVYLSSEYTKQIKIDYYKKTRFTKQNKHWLVKSFVEPSVLGYKKALRSDEDSFVKALINKCKENGCKFYNKEVIRINKNKVLLNGIEESLNSDFVNYDYIILTIPLWDIKKIAYWNVPNCKAVEKNILLVLPYVNRYSWWQSVYTPYTPEQEVSRIVFHEDNVAVEVNGNLNGRNKYILSDLNYLFKHGYDIQKVRKNLKGYMLPLDEKHETPKNIFAVGMYSEWDYKKNIYTTLKDSKKIANKLFANKRKRRMIMKRDKPFVYIASPYTHGRTTLNLRAHSDMFMKLKDEGIVTPVSWLQGHIIDMIHPRSGESWLEYDFELVRGCDAVLAINAQVLYCGDKKNQLEEHFVDKSEGREREIEVAQLRDIPVFYSVESLYKWVDEVYDDVDEAYPSY